MQEFAQLCQQLCQQLHDFNQSSPKTDLLSVVQKRFCVPAKVGTMAANNGQQNFRTVGVCLQGHTFTWSNQSCCLVAGPHNHEKRTHTREVHELAVSVHKVANFSRVPETPEILDRNRQFVDLPRTKRNSNPGRKLIDFSGSSRRSVARPIDLQQTKFSLSSLFSCPFLTGGVLRLNFFCSESAGIILQKVFLV